MGNESGRSILRGMMEQAGELGHQMVSYPINAKQKETSACDGYIVHLPMADAFARAIGPQRPPTVYIWAANADPRLQPLVQIDASEAQSRALRLLAEQGFGRIALIGLESVTPPGHILYEETMHKLGLPYRACGACDPDSAAVAHVVRRLFDRPDAPQAIYVADDIVMRSVAPALKAIGRIPGENLGLITYANRGNPLPAGANWSRMEFDPDSLGRIAVQSLLREIATAGEQLLSFSHQAAWRPGDTHRLKN
jgi:DNA-binding LacI/PurR family transcriptional regulator